MEEREMREFSWTGLFLVTGCCFFIFSAVMKMLEGEHVPFFTWIGLASLLLGTLSGISHLAVRGASK